jgi:hypothetical protein
MRLAWQARHPAAETTDRREAQRIFEECAGDPNWATVQYTQWRTNQEYIARVRNWAIGRPQHTSDYVSR